MPGKIGTTSLSVEESPSAARRRRYCLLDRRTACPFDDGGLTLSAGVYKWGTGLLIPTDVTLTGNATDVWIFQIAQNLTMSSAAKILLMGGAVPKNVFWQVAGLVDIGTTAHCEGVVLTQTSATLRTGASIHGRLLAQTAVSLDGSAVIAPPK